MKFNNKEEALAYVDDFLDLEENWDGHGGYKINPIVVDNVKKLIELSDSYGIGIDWIGPTPCGNIVIDYSLDEYTLLSLKLTEKRIGGFVDINRGKGDEEYSVAVDNVYIEKNGFPKEIVDIFEKYSKK